MNFAQAKSVMKRAFQDQATDAEIGEVMLFFEQNATDRFGIPSLLNRKNPNVRRFVKAANNKKGFA
jgi:hypothetical protein